MSRYFDWTTSLKRFIRFDTARAEDVNDALDELSAGLDEVDVDIDRALKFPAGSIEFDVAPEVRANKIFSFDPSGNPAVTPMVDVPNAVARTGDTMSGALINGFGDKQIVVIASPGEYTATAGVRYVIAAGGVTLRPPGTSDAPVLPGDPDVTPINTYHGIVVCRGVDDFIWNFGTTKFRSATVGELVWDLGPIAMDVVYQDKFRGYV